MNTKTINVQSTYTKKNVYSKSRRRQQQFLKKNSVVDPDSHGSACIWLSWIRIFVGNANPDPGARKLTKINKCTWIPAFQRGSYTFIGSVVDPLSFGTDPDPRFRTSD